MTLFKPLSSIESTIIFYFAFIYEVFEESKNFQKIVKNFDSQKKRRPNLKQLCRCQKYYMQRTAKKIDRELVKNMIRMHGA